MSNSTTSIVLLIAIMMLFPSFQGFFILNVYSQSEKRSNDNLLVTSDNTFNNIIKIFFNLANPAEYTVDLKASDIFPNQTIQDKILNNYEPTEYTIPVLNYRLLGFDISAKDIAIQTKSNKMEDNNTRINFPLMQANNVRVSNGLTDLSFNDVDLSSLYAIYDPETNKLTIHIPALTAMKYLYQQIQS
jgi:hypothetical protein